MYSADFLRRFAEIRRQSANQAATNVEASVDTGAPTDPSEEGQRMVGTRPSAYANTQAGTAQTTVYDPLTGKAYPNPDVATAEGVNNYVFQIPSGMNVDWSYWDKFKQPDPEPVSVDDTVEVADQTLPFNPPAPEPEPEPQPRPQQTVQPNPPPPPPPPPPKPVVAKQSAPRRTQSKPTPQPVRVASRDEWERQGTYMHGAGHSGPNSGKSLRGDRNNDSYYANYVRVMNEANKSGNYAHATEVNRAHSLPK